MFSLSQLDVYAPPVEALPGGVERNGLGLLRRQAGAWRGTKFRSVRQVDLHAHVADRGVVRVCHRAVELLSVLVIAHNQIHAAPCLHGGFRHLVPGAVFFFTLGGIAAERQDDQGEKQGKRRDANFHHRRISFVVWQASLGMNELKGVYCLEPLKNNVGRRSGKVGNEIHCPQDPMDPIRIRQ